MENTHRSTARLTTEERFILALELADSVNEYHKSKFADRLIAYRTRINEAVGTSDASGSK